MSLNASYNQTFQTTSGSRRVGSRFLIMLAVVLFVFGIDAISAMHKQTFHHCQVTDKSVTSTSKKTEMRIYSSCGTFKVADSVFMLRWNSADVYGSIDRGKTYDFTTQGYRIPFFSSFPNISKAKLDK